MAALCSCVGIGKVTGGGSEGGNAGKRSVVVLPALSIVRSRRETVIPDNVLSKVSWDSF